MMHSLISKSVDHLVWFGDSWPSGSPGPIDQAFPALVGNNLGITSLNYSVPGSSIPELLIQFARWKTQYYDRDKNYILIACLTNDNRFYWKDDDWFTIAPWRSEVDDSKYFYKHTYNREAVEFYNTCCIGHLKNLSNECNLPLYFLRNFKNMDEDCKKHSLFDTGLAQFLVDAPHAIWSPDCREDLKTQILKGQIGKGLFTDCAHPNTHGHKKIADILTDKLQLKIDSTS
jgi:hypothetical protein